MTRSWCLDVAPAVEHATALQRAKMPFEYPIVSRLQGSLGHEAEKQVVIRLTEVPAK